MTNPAKHWTHPSQRRAVGSRRVVSVIFISTLVMSGIISCSGGGGIGDSCSGQSDCGDGFQCSRDVCVPLCNRSQECGDGYSCSSSGFCQIAVGKAGSVCTTESACVAGLACVLDRTDVDNDGVMQSSCAPSQQGHAPGATCNSDDDCRNGTCAVGRCVDICNSPRDCGVGNACMSVPRVEAGGAQFFGCLPETGTIAYDLPGEGSQQNALIAVPGSATSFSLVMRIDDDSQTVGLSSLLSPRGRRLYSEWTTAQEFYGNPVRHAPQRTQSVAQVPSSVNTEFETGAYRVALRSYRIAGQPGTATPRSSVVLKMGLGSTLDLHLHFADLQDHACKAAFGARILDASQAATSVLFQEQFVSSLRTILGRAGISVGNITYSDVQNRPELDSVNEESIRSLFAQSAYRDGISIFFVRSLSPAGVAVLGESPGPSAAVANPSSGIAISTEALCYRSWAQVARTATHQIAGHMGLYPNIDLSNGQDPIRDTDETSDNLMFYSEVGGTSITEGQSQILRRSPVLR
jgi:hypothetical protein